MRIRERRDTRGPWDHYLDSVLLASQSSQSAPQIMKSPGRRASSLASGGMYMCRPGCGVSLTLTVRPSRRLGRPRPNVHRPRMMATMSSPPVIKVYAIVTKTRTLVQRTSAAVCFEAASDAFDTT